MIRRFEDSIDLSKLVDIFDPNLDFALNIVSDFIFLLIVIFQNFIPFQKEKMNIEPSKSMNILVRKNVSDENDL